MYSQDDLLRSVGRAAETVDNRRLFAGEPVDWDALIRQFDAAERACRLLGRSGPRSGVGVTSAAVPRRPAEQRSTSPIYG